MILGIDIGGTHTDAVCLYENRIIASAKVVTGEDLVESILGVVDGLGVDYSKVSRVVLSTTLCTNAIIEKKYPRTGMIISAGPGIDPRSYFLTEDFYLVDGAVDHRGREYVKLKDTQIAEVAQALKEKEITGLGIVAKFSTRNPSHERAIRDLICNDFQHISMGHRMSGSRNFPRRIYTAYFNSAVMPIQQKFVKAVKDALSRLGINAKLLFLKADGGTYMVDAAERLPVETIMSGPAASMMGTVALACGDCSTLVLDIGGTTTDIGILIDGSPILEKGVSVGGNKTLVRGLNVHSVGAGGDSHVRVIDGHLVVGPDRQGPPACMGGSSPTPMDALCVLGRFDDGNCRQAQDVLQPLAEELAMSVEELAQEIIRSMIGNIRQAAEEYIEEVNSHPVYTIHEMLHPETIVPRKVMVIGGPSQHLKQDIETAFEMECQVPEHSEVANALGAALARTTATITMLADTQLKRLNCPELDITRPIEDTLTLEELRDIGIRTLKENAAELGLAPDAVMDVVEEQSFNMVRGFSTIGRNLRLKIQTRPGIIRSWSKQ